MSPELNLGDWLIFGGMGIILNLGAYSVGPSS
jgi:hypothetical protein